MAKNVSIAGGGKQRFFRQENDGFLYETKPDYKTKLSNEPITDIPTLEAALGADTAKSYLSNLRGAEVSGKEITKAVDVSPAERQSLLFGASSFLSAGSRFANQTRGVTSPSADILSESTRVAQKAAESIGGTFKQGVGFIPNPTGDISVDEKEQIQKQSDDIALKKSSIETRFSTKDLFSGIESAIGKAPVRKSTAETFAELKATQGFGDVETEYNDDRNTLRTIENKILADADKIKGELVSSAVIGKKLVRLDAESANVLREARLAVQDSQDRLSTKQQTINTLMQLTRQDYADARNEYEFEFNKAIQIYNLADEKMQKQEKDALAKLQVAYNLLPKTGIDYDDLDEGAQLFFEGLETRAGFPIGMTKMAYNARPNQEIYTSIKNDDGSLTVFYKDPQTGKIDPKTTQIVLGAKAGGIGVGALSDVAQVADLVGGFASVNSQKVFMNSINRLSAQKDDVAVAEKIVGQVFDNIKGEEIRKRVIGGFKIARDLTRLEGLIDEYEAQGGETGLIKGNVQKINQKLGQVGDPELARIGTQMLNTLDSLARSRTGAVINPSEEELYNRMLPSVDKVGELNRAIISGLRNSLIFDVEEQLRFNITTDGLNLIKQQLPDVFESRQQITISDEEARKAFKEITGDSFSSTTPRQFQSIPSGIGKLPDISSFWQGLNSFFGK